MSTDYIDFSYPTDIFLNRLKNTVFAPFTSLAISVYHKDDDFFIDMNIVREQIKKVSYEVV